MSTENLPMQLIMPDMVRASIRRAKKSLEDAAKEILWQIEREAWVTLGYKSWHEMREAEYGGAAFMVPRVKRAEIVGQLRAAGLTQQEIAETAGVSHQTVGRDLANVQMDIEAEPAPTITNARGQQRPATYATRPDDEQPLTQADCEALEAERIEGTTKPRRTPLPEQFSRAVVELGRRTRALRSVVEDDRISSHRQNLAKRHRGELGWALDDLDAVFQALGLGRLFMVEEHALTFADAAPETFEAALAEAKAEGDLSANNVARHVNALQGEAAS